MRYRILLIALTAFLALAARAGDPLPGTSRDTALLATPESTFLPVEQAYPLSATIEAVQLRLHWNITPGYYL